MRFWVIVTSLVVSMGLGLAQERGSADATTYRLKVFSHPDSASVFIDDVALGSTPFLSTDINPGHHSIRLARAGYLDFVDSLNILDGQPISVNARLWMPGVLSVITQPPGARVYFDGRLLGISPLLASHLIPGRHMVKASVLDYKDVERPVLIPEADTARVIAKMINRYGTLSLLVDSLDGEIIVDGLSMGLGSLKDYKIEAGTHMIQVRGADSLDRIEQNLFVGPGAYVGLRARMRVATSSSVASSFFLPGYSQIRQGSFAEGIFLAVGAIASSATLAISITNWSSDRGAYDGLMSAYLSAKSEEDALRAHRALDPSSSALQSDRTRVWLSAGVLAAIFCYNALDVIFNHEFTTNFLEVAGTNAISPAPPISGHVRVLSVVIRP